MEYPVAEVGGVEAVVMALVRGLASEFSIVLVSDDDVGSLAAAGLAPLLAKHFQWRNGRSGAAEASNLAAALHEADVALAHFHFGGTYTWGSRLAHRCPVLATARRNIPVVITNHFAQLPLEGYCNPSRPLWLKLACFPVAWSNRLRVLRCARREFTVFLYDLKLARRIFWPLQSKIGHMYHSILDEQELGPALTADCRPPVILSVGTIARRKEQRVLVEAFALIASKHPEWRLRLVGNVGDQSYYDEIRTSDAARRLGTRLEFAGPLDRAETAHEMCGASIFFGQGLALQEGMFRGCACVGMSSISIPELIEQDRTGLLAPADDPAGLANALETLITQPLLRRQLAEQGRASIIAKGMTLQQMLRKHLGLYRSLLAHSA
jgi:glycosyltransferase involved in cell wall biosynthesis